MEITNLRSTPISYRGRLANYAKSCGWVLCVGAGTSNGIFPCWNDLAKRLFELARINCPMGELEKFLNRYGPEALMQAAVSALSEGDRERVPDYLSEVLYKELRERAGNDWKMIAKALTASKPSNLREQDWKAFDRFVSPLGNASAPQIAKVIANVVGKYKQPEAILSFNAEPLLYSLINCYYAFLNPESLNRDDVKVLKRLSHDLATRQRGQIPYCYIHGVMPVPDGRHEFNQNIGADKLVFTETQYLRLTRSAYSWQSATFLASCIHHRCVFVGLSFSDPNLRRWLAWEQEDKKFQRQHFDQNEDRHTHLWINQHSNAEQISLSPEQQLIQKSVDHLGVQVVWIKDWASTGDVLDLMLQESN